jgi:excisionase family DNA binding protein
VLLTVEQVAGLLRLNKQTVYNWIDASSLPAVNVGGRRVRIKRTELDHVAGEGFMMAASDLAPTDSADDFRLGTNRLVSR